VSSFLCKIEFSVKIIQVKWLFGNKGLNYLHYYKEGKKGYKHLCKSMMPMEFISLKEFHQWKLRLGESLSVFYMILLSGAMPGLVTAARNQLLLAGLPSSIGMQIWASGETSNLDKVKEWARLLLTVENHQPQHTAAMAPLEQANELSVLREKMALLTDQIKQTPVIRCLYCNQPGHIQRQCPVYRSQTRPPHHCFNCGKVGYIERDCW